MIDYLQELDHESIVSKKIDLNFKPKITIYFAHPYDTFGTKEEKEIEKILTERGFIVVNPFEEQHEKELNKKYEVNTYYDKSSLEFAKEIVNKDILLVNDCDAFFGWFPKGITIIGAAIELTWAEKFKKKIYCLSYKPHPFLWVMSDVLYIDFEDFQHDRRRYGKNIHK